MNDPRENELELWAEGQLKGLPDWPAPATLIPRVQARLAAAPARPARRGLWASWPAAGRMAFVFTVASLLAGLCWLTDWAAQTLAAEPAVRLSFSLGPIGRLGEVGAALERALALSVSAVPALWWWTAVGLALGMYGLSLALGTLCYRLAAQR